MPLKLVTGPANSAKAGIVLDDFRARLPQDPLLVVPAFQDVEHAQREMAASGAVLGARVMRFSWLFEEIARRAGYRAARAGEVERELIVEEAVRAAGLRVLARSAARPGFVHAAARFVAELGRAGVEPARFTRALRTWRPEGPRAAYAEDVARLYARYREGLDAAGLVDGELFAWRALEALRREPLLWGGSPVFVYGFDGFTELELGAIEALAERAHADVTVSLPFEPGRVAFRAVAGVFGRLAEVAAERVHLEGSDDHYANESRAALSHLERGLFGAPPGLVDGEPERRPAGGAVRLFAAGGQRAEVELVAAEVLRLLRGEPRIAPGDVAVVFREPDAYASVVEQVFAAYGIPYSIDRWAPLPHTSLGRGLLALMRAAGPGGTAEDLLAYLRTPGRLARRELADALEAEVRRQGVRSAADARRIWEETPRRWPLEELDRLAAAAGDPPAYLAELEVRLERLFAAPYRRRAHVLAGHELDDARVYAAARDALADLRRAAARGGAAAGALEPARVRAVLERLRVRLGETPQPDRVQVARPEAIRARRFQAVFVCGLQEGELPRRTRPEPFLPDEDRREIARASGLVLPVREDELERERYLFYVCVSRAERTLVLSLRSSDEEGNPESPSFFLEDVRDLLEGLEKPAAVRTLADVAWSPQEAPTRAEWERALARAGPRAAPAAPDGLRDPATIAELAGEWTFSASALEAFADCPVKWLVERRLEPNQLEPDPEQMVRGSYAHDVLQLTFARLRERTGEARVTPENLPLAEQILLEALREREASFRLSPKQTRVRTAVRRLEFDLLRLLRHEAESDCRFEPAELELAFGGEDGDAPAADLGLGDVRVRGRVDRVDTWDGWALVRDYKSGKNGYPVARWERDRRLQVPLYMLAVRKLLGHRLAGGVYQPLSGTKTRPRGILVEEAREGLGGGYVDNDWRSEDELEAHLEAARAAVRDVVERLRAGDVRPCPETCAWNGGCSYPAICRHER